MRVHAPFRRCLLIVISLIASGHGRVSAQAGPLVGSVSRSELRVQPFSDWFDPQYSKYQASEALVADLGKSMDGVSIEAYFGTWCGDSRRQIPRLIRILDLASVDESRLTLVALSDQQMQFKRSPMRSEAKRYIHRTPTIVVLRQGVEIGRIVETPSETIEADLLAILRGKGPAAKYGAEAWVHHLFTDLPSDEAEKRLATADAEVAALSSPDSLWHYADQDLMKNGRPREAKAVLDLHLRLNPRSVTGHVVMADALAELGRKAEALVEAEKALSLDPKDGRAQRTAARLR